MIDLVGFGSSSRPTFSIKDPQEADDYFVNALETWRQKMDTLTNFYVAAHSYGGYLWGTYAAKYPQHIRKLILLSPLGLKVAPENWDLKRMRFMRGRGPPKWAVAIARNLWGVVSPFSLLRLRSEKKIREFLNRYID